MGEELPSERTQRLIALLRDMGASDAELPDLLDIVDRDTHGKVRLPIAGEQRQRLFPLANAIAQPCASLEEWEPCLRQQIQYLEEFRNDAIGPQEEWNGIMRDAFINNAERLLPGWHELYFKHRPDHFKTVRELMTLMRSVLERVGELRKRAADAPPAAPPEPGEGIGGAMSEHGKPNGLDREFMERAVEVARKSRTEDGRVHPKVGVVVVKDGMELAAAYRGEQDKGEHAEFTALEKKLTDVEIAGATVYTTLEPCTTRNHPKRPCAVRLIERKVKRVVIGMFDPNPKISGRGQRKLREANIEIGVFPPDLMAKIEEMNREFIRHYENAAKRWWQFWK
jgi:pyrimidine deaminase RibD-like protein